MFFRSLAGIYPTQEARVHCVQGWAQKTKVQDHHTNPTPKTTTYQRTLTSARQHCIQAA